FFCRPPSLFTVFSLRLGKNLFKNVSEPREAFQYIPSINGAAPQIRYLRGIYKMALTGKHLPVQGPLQISPNENHWTLGH
ncbi:hypothetical protein, partial [uncultured Bilophila sp.]|uniref:hypothetical protein n=1 Tax=uncultured Bilophila sp. TaxID=529385 RepID=UPI00280B99AF